MSPRAPTHDFTACVVGDGRYQLIQKLGEGGYGVVYRAEDLQASSSSTAEVAIKILRKAGLSEREATNVRRELGLHKAMSDHPHVVTMHDAFEDKHYVYIVLEYCPGGDLFSKVVEQGLYFRDDELLRKVFLQIIDALHACHRKRICHRDLKPENILSNEDGSEVYIADFGLATMESSVKVFKCGSSKFLPLSECIGEETERVAYSPKHADIWALGVLLVNMVTARSPWEKAVTTDDCFHDFLVDPTFLPDMLPISKGLHQILLRMFELEPLDRISLVDLRKEIAKLDTFFATDEEVAKASQGCQLVTKDLVALYDLKNKQLAQLENKEQIVEVEGTVFVFPVVPKPIPTQAQPESREDTPAGSPAFGGLADSDVFTIGSISSDGSSLSSSAGISEGLSTLCSEESSSDSMGVITPESSLPVLPPIASTTKFEFAQEMRYMMEAAAKLELGSDYERPRGPLRVVNQTSNESF
ncbi:kinase-like protein [Panus rudis PR-1116 ss-1]|nr:kinase-like protein [Panus rudis PR-1116 ss-1]